MIGRPLCRQGSSASEVKEVRNAKVWLGACGIVLKGDEALVVKKTYGGLKGKWSFPAGFVQPGETVDQAAVREVLEETGITATVRQVAAIRSGVIRGEISDNMVVFVMDYVSGEPRPQEGEIAEAMFLPIARLIEDPLSTTYMKIILPHVPGIARYLTGREYEIDPVFEYTAYKIFT
jgi:8-oxo-dGTP diphosphatase